MTAQTRIVPSCPVDLTEMKKTVGGKMGVIRILVDHILAEYPEKMSQLRHGLQSGDAGQIRTIAHTLKSSLASFGAKDAREIAATLEVSGAKGELAVVERLLPQFEQEIEKIVFFFSGADWMDKI